MLIVLDFLLKFVEMSFVFEVSSESRIQQSIGVPEMSHKDPLLVGVGGVFIGEFGVRS